MGPVVQPADLPAGSRSPVNLAAKLELELTLLASFAGGHRHLAYLRTQLGFDAALANLPSVTDKFDLQLGSRASRID